MPENLVINTMLLQMSTEGLNTDVHYPGGGSGATIGPGFDIGASGVKAADLQTILDLVGLNSSKIKLLLKTTVENAGEHATGSSVPQYLVDNKMGRINDKKSSLV
jgi:hypothetical protein